MRWKFPALLPFLLICVFCGKKLPVSMITATSMESGLPFDILDGKKWRPEKGANFVKLHVYPDEAFLLSKIEIESCGEAFTDPITAYINFDEYNQDLAPKGSSAIVEFPSPKNARSVTFNFHKNANLCVDKVSFYDEKGSKMKWKGPKIVEASVKASETAKPVLSYDVMNLFDSRYEYAWASDKKGAGVVLDFEFKDKQKIKSLKIWNGYQRSDSHCQTNGRLKTATLTGDDGSTNKIEVQDVMGPQTISLSKPFEGRKLRLTVDSIYGGKTYKGLIISELRFSDGEEWILPNPIEQVRKIAKENALQFAAANITNVLNWSYVGGEYSGEIPVAASVAEETKATNSNPPPAENDNAGEEVSKLYLESSNWTLRLRSDGSMFLEGNTTDTGWGNRMAKSFFALGNYEIKEATPEGLKLRIFGLVRQKTSREQEQEEYFGGDCNGCGRDCNMGNSDPDDTEKIFQETIRIRKFGDKIYVQNENPDKVFHFKLLELGQE
ncbi:discoidin domain-containing protein [Leptospira fluminis]|uniref:Discoidin domain-containing protein n=1 Tax=Leptospira fluminis TaxID=2484979 RepID=A0A4R9GQA7_9LEPT|nr:discoidin domain-containing protein [Leptospira fluminis]TGK19278.1 discoidin domain-containing protein [Leptospira fluminis]